MKKNLPDILNRSIRSVNKLLINGETSVAAIHAESSKIVQETKVYNPFITICQNESSNTANLLDERLKNIRDSTVKQGSSPGLSSPGINMLFGIPISIKDNFCIDQVLTTCASKMLHNFVPNYTATPVSKLLGSNCLMMGKTNMDEFAMGSSSVSSYFGPTANSCREENLHNLKQDGSIDSADSWFMAGGSSTGSAVSVASGACFASLGSDTGGSTRQPASLTGVLGFKPTYGLISRFGLIPLVNCLDVVSIFTRNVDDMSLVFNEIIGPDDNDLTSIDYKQHLKRKFQGHSDPVTIRIGVPEKFISDGNVGQDIANRLNDVMVKLSSRDVSDPSTNRKINFHFSNLELVSSRLSTECYTIISSTEISSNMSCYDGVKFGYSSKIDRTKPFDREQFFKANRDEGFGLEVKKRIMLGNYFLMSENREKYLDQAVRLRRAISDEFQNAFSKHNIDFLLTPSTPNTSISYSEWLTKQSDNELFHEDYFLIPSNLANLPSISLPAGLSANGLPIGMQLTGNKFDDLDLLYVSSIFENEISNCF